MFADRAKIYIRSGKGGDGHVSFRRELYVPNGGPDGGDGGKGGDVIFEVDKGMNALTDYRHKSKYTAGNGEEGGKKDVMVQTERYCIKVPEGTVIKEAASGKVIADMSGANTRQVVLRGGVVEREISIMQQQPCRYQSMPSRDSRHRSWKCN